MSYFGDHFWGDKNSGFAVLYHNMKHGQLSIKELAEFVRERAAVEEAYSKSMQKLSKMVSSGSHLGTFAPMWEMFRVSSDKLALCHLELSKKLHDLIKDINKYGDEQVKVHKKAKEEMSGTLEVIQLLQCSSQLLQKSRDIYCGRFAEQERLRREGALQKEMDKAELKTQKAAESLRGSVEKYNAVRKEFEEKMLQSAQLFQDTEAAHLTQMKRLVAAYSHSIEDTHVQIGQVQEEFKHNMENVAVEKLIRKFAESNGTGTERPGVKRTWSKPFRIRGLSRREKEAQHEVPDVDEDGFTRRPDENLTRESSVACCSSSDSDFDDDDEPRRYRIQIKPPQSGEREEDEEAKMKRLRDTVVCMIQPPAAVVSVRRQTVRNNSLLHSFYSSSDSNSDCNSHPVHSSFGPLQESVFEPDDFPVCRTYTLASSPSPFSSSSPENVEDSGLDSPFHPFSVPSPDSRPWTPRDDSSTTDSVLVTSSFNDSPSNLTNSNSNSQQHSERRDTWEHKPLSNLQCDPTARCSERRLLWQIPNTLPGKESEGHGNLYARWQPLRNCSTPSPAAAQFTCEGRTLSGVDIELVGSGYRMSLVKKRFAAESALFPPPFRSRPYLVCSL
ncbi:hypothetical protein GDO81_001302 [Engystomops pustulosus]|uniref:F-BAR domain-containing protein n=1 Tax=Engystomops pustulosus TaxID=76066 RepID=A0AAV7DF51_ENGPU|nr:hypothetical protein GDO81_001302 [Engystomops pustulosus]